MVWWRGDDYTFNSTSITRQHKTALTSTWDSYNRQRQESCKNREKQLFHLYSGKLFGCLPCRAAFSLHLQEDGCKQHTGFCSYRPPHSPKTFLLTPFTIAAALVVAATSLSFSFSFLVGFGFCRWLNATPTSFEARFLSHLRVRLRSKRKKKR